MQVHVDTLRSLQQFMKTVVDNPELDWRDKYKQIFSDHCAARARAAFNALNISFDYYDPDMDYADDVRAYYNAFNSRMDEIRPILDAACLIPALPVITVTAVVPTHLSMEEQLDFLNAQIALAKEAAPALEFEIHIPS